MPKVYYFIQRDSKLDLLGHESSHWNVSFDSGSKNELRNEYTHGSQYVKTSEIYSPQQLIEKYSTDQIRSILREIKRYHPEKFQKK